MKLNRHIHELEILQKKYELGMISELELMQAETSLAQQESALITTQFEHMLKVDALEDTSLL